MTTTSSEEPPGTWLGTSYRTLLSDAETGGGMSIVDSTSPPGSGPPRHVHKVEDETFVILTGQVKFWMEGEESERGAGETMFIPRGKAHTFRVSDDGPSRHLLILSPGGFEGFFAEMILQQYRIPEDMDRVVEIAARFNLEFTGPPLDS